MKLSSLIAPLMLCLCSVAADDVALGLQGLMEAAKDPALLAQLLEDMKVIAFSACFSGLSSPIQSFDRTQK